MHAFKEAIFLSMSLQRQGHRLTTSQSEHLKHGHHTKSREVLPCKAVKLSRRQLLSTLQHFPCAPLRLLLLPLLILEVR